VGYFVHDSQVKCRKLGLVGRTKLDCRARFGSVAASQSHDKVPVRMNAAPPQERKLVTASYRSSGRISSRLELPLGPGGHCHALEIADRLPYSRCTMEFRMRSEEK
jgi:hypothetical protein